MAILVPVKRNRGILTSLMSDDTVPYTFEQSLCQLLFPNLEHFNCGRKFRLCACLKRMNTEMCFCACVYMKSVRTTIIRQSNSIQNRQHTTRDSLGYHVFTKVLRLLVQKVFCCQRMKFSCVPVDCSCLVFSCW
jgi:hypothetical protein